MISFYDLQSNKPPILLRAALRVKSQNSNLFEIYKAFKNTERNLDDSFVLNRTGFNNLVWYLKNLSNDTTVTFVLDNGRVYVVSRDGNFASEFDLGTVRSKRSFVFTTKPRVVALILALLCAGRLYFTNEDLGLGHLKFELDKFYYIHTDNILVSVVSVNNKDHFMIDGSNRVKVFVESL